jgi:exonuclease VII large subunit
VADRHFSTPTAVAAFFRIAREELLAWIENQGVMLENGMLARFNGMEESLAHTREDMIFAFGRIVERANFRISRAAHSISSILARVFNSFRTLEKSFLTALFQFEAGMREERHFIGIQARKIEHLFETLLIFSKGRMDLLQNTIEELNPEKILARGYSIVHRKQNNKILSDAEEATIGEELVIRFHRNRLISVVKEKE